MAKENGIDVSKDPKMLAVLQKMAQELMKQGAQIGHESLLIIKKEIEKDKKNKGQFYKDDYEENLKKRKK